jgi:hypothetical protein
MSFWRHLQGTGTRTESGDSLPSSDLGWGKLFSLVGSLRAGLPWGGAPLDAGFQVVTHFSPRGWQASFR